MSKALAILLVVLIIIIGGGYYFYTNYVDLTQEDTSAPVESAK